MTSLSPDRDCATLVRPMHDELVSTFEYCALCQSAIGMYVV
jgi:hypothetical protein